MLRKAEDRLKKGDSDHSATILELENKYLRDIRVLNDNFDAYKKQMEKHMSQLVSEKTSEKK